MKFKTRIFTRVLKTVLPFLASFLMLFQSLAPAAIVFAQEATVPSEVEGQPSPTPSDEPSISLSPSDNQTPSDEPQPSVEPSSSPAPSDQPQDNNNLNPDNQSQPANSDEQSNNQSPSPPESNSATDESNSAPTDVVGDEHISVDLVSENSGTLSPTDLFGQPYSEPSAYLSTDKPDYSPAEAAVISGSGFNANTTYTLVITSEDPPAVNFSTDITTSDQGIFTYTYQLDGNYRPNYKVEVKDSTGTVIATTTFTDSGAKIDKLYSDAALSVENYQFAVGQTVYAKATSLTAIRGYKLEAKNASGTSAYLGSCKTGATTASDSYAPTTVSGSTNWTWVLHEWTSNTCTSGAQSEDGDNTFTFNVAQTTAYTTSSLTTTTTTYTTGATAYVVVNGVKPDGDDDFEITWIKPNGTVACANLGGGDRPDSNSSGRLPDTTGSFLQFPPNATDTGDQWNQNSKYDATCLATGSSFASNPGTWSLKLTPKDKPTEGFTVQVFTISTPDTTAPTDPQDVQSTSHEVDMSSSDNTIDMAWTVAGAAPGATDAGSGVDGYSYEFSNSSTTVPDTTKDAEETATGTISSVLADGTWYFHLRTRDNSDNWTSTVHAGPFIIDTTVQVKGFKYFDSDQNGSYDGNDYPLENWTLCLYPDGNNQGYPISPFECQSTGADGFVEWTVPVGSEYDSENFGAYHGLFMQESNQTGWTNTFPPNGGFNVDISFNERGEVLYRYYDGESHNVDVPRFGNWIDTTPPVLESSQTQDTNGNGKIDAILLTFSENIDDSLLNTGSSDGWDVDGYDGEAISTGESDNDNVLALIFNEGGSFDTGVTPAVTYSPSGEINSTHDTAGNELEGLETTPDDNASPVLVSAVTQDTDPNGHIDRVLATFSENLNDDSVTNDKFEVSSYSIVNVLLSGNIVEIILEENSFNDTGAKPDVSVFEGDESEVEDLNGNAALETNVTAADGAAPVSTIDTPQEGSFENSVIEIAGNSSDGTGDTVLYTKLFYRLSDSEGEWTEITESQRDNENEEEPYEWSFTWTPDSEGTYDIKVESTDDAGNTEQSPIVRDVTYDITDPTSDITYPEEDISYTEDEWEDQILGTAQDNTSGINSLLISIQRDSDSMYWDGENWSGEGDEEILNEANFEEGSWDFDFAFIEPQGDDEGYTVRSHAVDNAQNQENTSEVHFFFSHGLPIISNENTADVGSAQVTFVWNTDIPATSRVVYDTVSHPDLGAAPNYGYANSTGESDTDPKVTAHTVVVCCFDQSTTYYYRVISQGSPEAASGEKSFTTPATPPQSINPNSQQDTTTTSTSQTTTGTIAGAITQTGLGQFFTGGTTGEAEEVLGEATPAASPSPSPQILGTESQEQENASQSKKPKWLMILLVVVFGVGILYFLFGRRSKKDKTA